MPVSWEAVSASATVLSAAVVVATVVVGIRGVRLAAAQVEHLRRTTQLDGTMAIFDELNGPEVRAAVRFVVSELPAKMRDPAFRAEVALVGSADSATHHELIVLRTFEKIGTYVKHGLLDGDIIYDYSGPWIVWTWARLNEAGVIPIHRELISVLWLNFEYLEAATRRWNDEHGQVLAMPPAPDAVPAENVVAGGPEA